MTDILKGNVVDSTPIGDNHGGKLVGRNKLVDDSNNEIGSKNGTRAYGTPAARIAIASASGVSAALTLPKGEVLLHASSRCFIWFGSGTPVATTDCIPLEAGEKFHLQMPTTQKVAVIRDTADGFLNIIPVA